MVSRLLPLLCAAFCAPAFAMTPAVPFANDRPVVFSYSETLDELTSTPDCEVGVRRSLSDATAPIRADLSVSLTGIDPAGITPDTPFSFDLGYLSLSGELGDDPGFAAGATSATIDIETDFGQPVGESGVGGTIRFDWSDGQTLNVTVRIRNSDEFNFPVASDFLDELFVDEDVPEAGPEEIEDGQITCTFQFAGRELEREVYYRGFASARYFGFECEETLDTVSIVGNMNDPAAAVGLPAADGESRVRGVSLSGTATTRGFSDLFEVQVSVNGKDPEFATFTSEPVAPGADPAWSWSIDGVQLDPGDNAIAVVAVDFDDAESAAAVRTINYPAESPVNLTITGSGTVRGAVAGDQLMPTATVRNLRAVPAPGSFFAGWTGAVVSANPEIAFEVVPDMQLAVAFVSPALEREYAGWADPADPQSPGPLGIVLRVTPFGTFTGRLIAPGGSVAIRGKFDAFGGFVQTINLPGYPPLELALAVDPLDFQNEIGVALAGAGPGVAFDAGPVGAGFAGGLAGRYTAAILPDPSPAPDPSARPAGNGFGFFKIEAGRRARFYGRLGDGTAFSATMQPAGAGEGIVLAQPHAGAGFFGGRLFFRETPGASDADGPFAWWRPAGKRFGKTYPAGFRAAAPVIASKFAPPAAGVRIFPDNAAAGTFAVADEGGVLFAQPVLIDANNAVTPQAPDPAKLRVRINRTSGLFGTTFLHPDGKARRFQGVVLQKANAGLGYFVDGAETGSVELESGP